MTDTVSCLVCFNLLVLYKKKKICLTPGRRESLQECCSRAELTQNPAERTAEGEKTHLRQAISLGYQNPGESEEPYSFSVLQGAGEHFSCWLGSEDALMSFWIRAINHKAQLKAGLYPEPCSYCLYTAASEMFPLQTFLSWTGNYGRIRSPTVQN